MFDVLEERASWPRFYDEPQKYLFKFLVFILIHVKWSILGHSSVPRGSDITLNGHLAAPRPSSGHAGSPFGKTGVAHEVFSGRIWYVRTLKSVPGCGERATIGLKKSDASRRNRVTLIFFCKSLKVFYWSF